MSEHKFLDKLFTTLTDFSTAFHEDEMEFGVFEEIVIEK